ncbi:MAG TPA: alpha/beta hydrolase-fold protein [Candidatus Binatia bacterium]
MLSLPRMLSTLSKHHPARRLPRSRATAAIALLASLIVAPLLTSTARATELVEIELSSPLVDTSAPGGEVRGGPRPLVVRVLLPDGYDRFRGRRYPVLWLLHGANEDPNRWDLEDFEGLDAILVMPEGGRLGMYTDWWNGGAFGTPQWATYLLEEVRRTIHERFRIRPERRWHAIAGISMGGQGALRFASLLPGYFGSVVALSSAFPNIQAPEVVAAIPAVTGVAYEDVWGPPDGAYATGMNPIALAPNLEHTRVYLLSGDGTNCPGDPPGPTFELDGLTEQLIRSQQAPYAAELRAAGASVATREPCGVHTFGVWRRAFRDVRATWGFFAPVRERPRAWTYRTASRAGEMWGLGFEFAEQPTELVEFRRNGSRLTASGSGTVTITGARGCRFTAELPFARRLPAGC